MTHAPATLTIASLGLAIAVLMSQTPFTSGSHSHSIESAWPAREVAATPAAEGLSDVAAERVVFAFPSDEVVYENALATFEASGFEVPEFLARFHDTGEPCSGHFGLHVRTSDGVSTVNVCRTMERETAQQMARVHTLLHEMAHAWVDQNVTAPQMDAFMALRGLTVWEGNGDDWDRLGAEHAAEILLWGMTEGSRNINFQIDQADTTNLTVAYEILIRNAVGDRNGRSVS